MFRSTIFRYSSKFVYFYIYICCFQSSPVLNFVNVHIGNWYRKPSKGGHSTKHGLDWTGLDWTGLDWTGLDWTGLDWTGLDWTGLDWTGLDWTGLDWTGLDRF